MSSSSNGQDRSEAMPPKRLSILSSFSRRTLGWIAGLSITCSAIVNQSFNHSFFVLTAALFVAMCTFVLLIDVGADRAGGNEPGPGSRLLKPYDTVLALSFDEARTKAHQLIEAGAIFDCDSAARPLDDNSRVVPAGVRDVLSTYEDVAVRETGCGISREMRPLLFDSRYTVIGDDFGELFVGPDNETVYLAHDEEDFVGRDPPKTLDELTAETFPSIYHWLLLQQPIATNEQNENI